MKKRITTMLAAALLVLILLPTAAFAHGHGGKGSQNTGYSACTVKNCNTTGVHKHGSTYDAGHSLNDGHEHHEICPVPGCTKAIAHDHDGTTYFGHHNEDGHTYHTGGRHNGSHRSGGRHH